MSPADVLAFAEATAVAEEVAAIVRHDLKNRFAVIRGAAYYLRRRVKATDLWEADPRMQQFFSTVDGEIDTATALLNERLTFGLMQVRRPRPHDMAECVRTAVRAARVDPDRRVHVEAAVRAGRADIDPTEMALALRCLVENAVEATPDGGLVEVSGGPRDGTVLITVTDTGPGMDEDEAERMMLPFVTTKAGHRGLGLNIARRICKRYGGDVTIRRLPSGTSVSVRLPGSRASDGEACS